jgi:hypothetical protein
MAPPALLGGVVARTPKLANRTLSLPRGNVMDNTNENLFGIDTKIDIRNTPRRRQTQNLLVEVIVCHKDIFDVYPQNSL